MTYCSDGDDVTATTLVLLLLLLLLLLPMLVVVVVDDDIIKCVQPQTTNSLGLVSCYPHPKQSIRLITDMNM
jgi:hypothetical protein